MILNVAGATYYNTIAAVASAAAELTPRRATQGVGGSDFKGGGSITHQKSKVRTHNRRKALNFQKSASGNPNRANPPQKLEESRQNKSSSPVPNAQTSHPT